MCPFAFSAPSRASITTPLAPCITITSPVAKLASNRTACPRQLASPAIAPPWTTNSATAISSPATRTTPSDNTTSPTRFSMCPPTFAKTAHNSGQPNAVFAAAVRPPLACSATSTLQPRTRASARPRRINRHGALTSASSARTNKPSRRHSASRHVTMRPARVSRPACENSPAKRSPSGGSHQSSVAAAPSKPTTPAPSASTNRRRVLRVHAMPGFLKPPPIRCAPTAPADPRRAP